MSNESSEFKDWLKTNNFDETNLAETFKKMGIDDKKAMNMLKNNDNLENLRLFIEMQKVNINIESFINAVQKLQSKQPKPKPPKQLTEIYELSVSGFIRENGDKMALNIPDSIKHTILNFYSFLLKFHATNIGDKCIVNDARNNVQFAGNGMAMIDYIVRSSNYDIFEWEIVINKLSTAIYLGFMNAWVMDTNDNKKRIDPMTNNEVKKIRPDWNKYLGKQDYFNQFYICLRPLDAMDDGKSFMASTNDGATRVPMIKNGDVLKFRLKFKSNSDRNETYFSGHEAEMYLNGRLVVDRIWIFRISEAIIPIVSNGSEGVEIMKQATIIGFDGQTEEIRKRDASLPDAGVEAQFTIRTITPLK